MPTSNRALTCSLRLPDGDTHHPVIHVVSGQQTLCRIPTGSPDPRLPLPDASVHTILALDVLEHVQDEQTWLAEFARVLVPGGSLRLRVPMENAMAWLDALNIYRYVSDTLGTGEPAQETMPLGWHRHYTHHDLETLLTTAGFEPKSRRTEGVAASTLPHLAGLLIGNIVLGRPGAERQLFDRRSRGRPGSLLPLPSTVAAHVSMLATRVRQGLDPDPDLDPDDRPEESATTPLE